MFKSTRSCAATSRNSAFYDQVDPTDLAAAEAMSRRLQTIEFSYLEKVRDLESKNADSFSRLAQEAQAIFRGMARVDSALMISPLLLDFARSEAERSASLAKNRHQARGECGELQKT